MKRPAPAPAPLTLADFKWFVRLYHPAAGFSEEMRVVRVFHDDADRAPIVLPYAMLIKQPDFVRRVVWAWARVPVAAPAAITWRWRGETGTVSRETSP